MRALRACVCCLAGAAFVVALPVRAAQAPPAAPPATPATGDLAVLDVKTYWLGANRPEGRLLVRALIENQSAADLPGPFRLVVRERRSGAPLGGCRGDALPHAQVAVCEVWLRGDAAREGMVVAAALDRNFGGLARWDTTPSDDAREVVLRSTTDAGQVLDIRKFALDPTVIRGSADATYRFEVDGAHMVWLLLADRPARLLGAHPADGPLTGSGRVQVAGSGLVTLVARNSLGTFAYDTVAVLDTRAAGRKSWLPGKPAALREGDAIANVLDPGVYDVQEEDALVLAHIKALIAGE